MFDSCLTSHVASLVTFRNHWVFGYPKWFIVQFHTHRVCHLSTNSNSNNSNVNEMFHNEQPCHLDRHSRCSQFLVFILTKYFPCICQLSRLFEQKIFWESAPVFSIREYNWWTYWSLPGRNTENVERSFAVESKSWLPVSLNPVRGFYPGITDFYNGSNARILSVRPFCDFLIISDNKWL